MAERTSTGQVAGTAGAEESDDRRREFPVPGTGAPSGRVRLDGGVHRAPRRTWGSGTVLLAAAAGYAVLAVVVWWGVWSSHPTATTTCGCGDSALFLWFFAWPAHALAHGLDPVHSTAMSHPAGVNLLANTSELALGVVLAPVTWLWGPVASMNVALTLAPALSGLAMFALVRRWVDWAPAAFIAGLLYGFSPLVLVSLSDAHLMLGWAVVPPLVLACIDELVRGRRRPVAVGLVLGLLVVVQFFVGTEVLLLLGILGALAALVGGAWALGHRDASAAAVHRLATGLATAAVAAGVVLAWPAWFALAGPGHTSGRVWPTLELGTEGTTVHAFLWPTPVSAGFTLFTHRVGGYQGPTLSGQYLGLGLVVVTVAGLVVWRRDCRLWLLGGLALVSAVLSLGVASTVWLPWRLVADLPLVQNIIPSRFVLVTYLALAAMVAIVVDRTRTAVAGRLDAAGAAHGRSVPPPDPSGRAMARSAGPPTDPGPARRWLPAVAGLAVGVVALGPIAGYLAPTVPMTTQAVRAPAWVSAVAPRLPAHQVLLVFPVPYQVIESSMAWQAVVGFPYAMVGGGGPGGVVERAGAERAGAAAIGRASFSFTAQVLRPGDVSATRHALAAWGVTGVVLPDGPGLRPYDRVTSVPYTVAFVTAVLGRAPVRQAGSWVWAGVAAGTPSGPGPASGALAGCVALGASGSVAAVERVADCVLALG